MGNEAAQERGVADLVVVAMESPSATPKQHFVRFQDDKSVSTGLERYTRNSDDESTHIDWIEEIRQQAMLMWPIIAASILEYVPGLVCTILVGHIDDGKSKVYVGAATLSQMITMLTCLSIGFGMTSALDTLCSQAHGAGYNKKIGVYLQSGLIVVGLMFIPMFFLNWYAEDLLTLVGLEHEVAHLAGQFSRITIFGMPFVLLYDLLRKLLTAQNVVHPMVIAAIVGDLVNIFGGYYFTYHSSLGYRGAALARAVGNVIMPIVLLAYILWTKFYKAWWAGWDFKEAWRYAGMFLRLGFPGMLMLQMEWWSFQLMALMAGLLPDSVVAISTHAVLVNFSTTIFMVYVGISVAGCVRIGNALGSNRPKSARAVCIVSLGMVVVSALILALFAILFRFRIPKLLVNDATAALRAANLMPLIAAFSISDGINCVMQSIYRGMGRQKVAVWSNAIGYYVVGVSTSAVCGFVFKWGLAGLWWGCLLGTIANVFVLGVVLCKTDWQKRADEAQARTRR